MAGYGYPHGREPDYSRWAERPIAESLPSLPWWGRPEHLWGDAASGLTDNRPPVEDEELDDLTGAEVRLRNWKYVKGYLAFKRDVERVSPKTTQRLGYALGHYLRWLNTRAAERATQRTIVAYLATLDIATGTLRLRYSELGGFYGWMVENRRMKTNPMTGLRKPREPRRVPKGLRPADVAALYDACETERQVVIITLMVQAGLRAKEVALLEVADVDLDARTARVVGKGDNERVVPLSDEAAEILTPWLRGRSRGAVVQSETTQRRRGVVQAKPTHLQPQTVSWIARRIFRRAGVDGSGHKLRHTCATDMLKNGAHVKDVQYVLGHQSVKTTEVYLPESYSDNLLDAVNGRTYRK